MGTSTSQRSPSNPEWERVRELYRQPAPDPGKILSSITQALDHTTRAGFKDAGVLCCFDSLLTSARDTAAGGLNAVAGISPAVQQNAILGLGNALRDNAREQMVSRQLSSRFGDLAVAALGTTLMSIAEDIPGGIFHATAPQVENHFGAYYSDHRLAELSCRFLAHDLEQAFRYFVARDISDFVGTKALPTASSSAILEDRIALECRRVTGHVNMASAEDTLHNALVATDVQERDGLLHAVFNHAVDEGLELLVAAGGLA